MTELENDPSAMMVSLVARVFGVYFVIVAIIRRCLKTRHDLRATVEC